MNRRWNAWVLAAVVAGLSWPCQAQVYQTNIQRTPGQVLDRSPQLGTGGLNTGSGYGGYGTGLRDSQLYVTGQTTGLSAFRGPVPYTASDQFQINLPSAGLSSFTRRSTGLADVLSGRTISVAPYFDRSQTILRSPQIQAGLASPGTNVPVVPTVDASVRATLNSQQYVEVLSEYRQLLPSSPGRDLSVPLMAVPGEDSPAGAPAPAVAVKAQEEAGAGMLLGILGERDRALLGQEFYDLAHPGRMLEANYRQPVDTRVYAEANFRPPGEPNQWRMTRTVPLGRGDPNAILLPAGQADADAFADLWEKVRAVRGLAPGEAGRGESNAGAAPQPARAGTLVEVQGGLVVVRSLGGRGRDLANRYMRSADEFLKAGRFYQAAEEYAKASALGPHNPLPRVGAGLAMFGAGEALTAAREIQAALEVFPPLMEDIRLDFASLMNVQNYRARLRELDERLSRPEADREALLPFLACYLHFQEADLEAAKTYAQQVRQGSGQSKVLLAFADYVLTGRSPRSATTQPTTAPAAQPAKAPEAAARP